MEEMTELQEIKEMLAEILLRIPAPRGYKKTPVDQAQCRAQLMKVFQRAVDMPNAKRNERSYPPELSKRRPSEPDLATPMAPLALIFNRCTPLKSFSGGSVADVRAKIEKTLRECPDIVVMTMGDAGLRKHGSILVAMSKKTAIEMDLDLDKAVVIGSEEPAPEHQPEPITIPPVVPVREPEPVVATEPEPEIEPAITLRKGLTPLVIRERTAYGG